MTTILKSYKTDFWFSNESNGIIWFMQLISPSETRLLLSLLLYNTDSILKINRGSSDYRYKTAPPMYEPGLLSTISVFTHTKCMRSKSEF